MPRQLSFLLKFLVKLLEKTIRFLICKAAIVKSNEINSITIFFIYLSLSLALTLSLSISLSLWPLKRLCAPQISITRDVCVRTLASIKMKIQNARNFSLWPVKHARTLSVPHSVSQSASVSILLIKWKFTIYSFWVFVHFQAEGSLKRTEQAWHWLSF